MPSSAPLGLTLLRSRDFRSLGEATSTSVGNGAQSADRSLRYCGSISKGSLRHRQSHRQASCIYLLERQDMEAMRQETNSGEFVTASTLCNSGQCPAIAWFLKYRMHGSVKVERMRRPTLQSSCNPEGVIYPSLCKFYHPLRHAC